MYLQYLYLWMLEGRDKGWFYKIIVYRSPHAARGSRQVDLTHTAYVSTVKLFDMFVCYILYLYAKVRIGGRRISYIMIASISVALILCVPFTLKQ